jgi:hypothetical protein
MSWLAHSTLFEMDEEKSPQEWPAVSIPMPANKESLVPQQNQDQDHNDYDHKQQDDPAPDGGVRAWLVVVGGFLGYFATLGKYRSRQPARDNLAEFFHRSSHCLWNLPVVLPKCDSGVQFRKQHIVDRVIASNYFLSHVLVLHFQ